MITLRHALRLLVFLAIAGALYLIYRAVSRFTIDEILASVAEISLPRLAASLAFAAASYLCLSGFDALALAYLRRRLPYPKILMASFVSLSIGHTVGFAALSSGALRYRFYHRWGLGRGEIAKLIVFCGVTVGLGLCTLAGLAFIFPSANAPQLPVISANMAPFVGVILLFPAVLYIALAAYGKGELGLFRWSIELPSLRIALGQVAIGVANFLCVAASLHQLLLAFGDVSLWAAVRGYCLSNMTALVSHAPGGLGVLEATLAYLMPGTAAIGALVAFRLTYFFIPLGIGLIVLLISELYGARHTLRASPKHARDTHGDRAAPET